MNTLEQSDRFGSLPKDFQEAISKFDYDRRLQGIHKHFALHIDQSAALEDMLANIIFGEMRSHQLIEEVQRKLRLTHDKSQELSQAINKDILVPLREKIKEVQSADNAEKNTDQENNTIREVL